MQRRQEGLEERRSLRVRRNRKANVNLEASMRGAVQQLRVIGRGEAGAFEGIASTADTFARRASLDVWSL